MPQFNWFSQMSMWMPSISRLKLNFWRKNNICIIFYFRLQFIFFWKIICHNRSQKFRLFGFFKFNLYLHKSMKNRSLKLCFDSIINKNWLRQKSDNIFAEYIFRCISIKWLLSFKIIFRYVKSLKLLFQWFHRFGNTFRKWKQLS